MDTLQKSRHLLLALLALAAALLLYYSDPESSSSASGSTPAPSAPAGSVQFSMPSGPYAGAINVSLSSSLPHAPIYFTTDGSLPTPENGTLYSSPIHLAADQPRTAVLRAAALLPNGEIGPATSAGYFINMESKIPILSLVVDPQDLYDEQRGIFANPFFSGIEWEREADIFYYDPQQGTGVSAPAGVRVHGASSRSYDKKSLRLNFRDDYGQPYLEYPLFPDADKTRFKRLVIHNGGQDLPAVSLNGTLLRNHLMGNLAREIGGFATYSRPALLFINGELWGVYNIRERIDDRYLEENFNIEDADLLHGFEDSLEAASGDRTHWDHLIEFIDANDLMDADNYDYVQTQINVSNFIDYTLFQIITANSDWPHNNQLKFRDRAGGRWQWMFWDADYAFGLMTDSYIEKNMFEHLLENDFEMQQKGSLLLRKLLENPQFKKRFLSRLADLLNTTFAPNNILTEVDRLAAGVEQDMPYETRRWPGPGSWQAGVDYMRDFARQRPDVVRRQTVETFGLSGTAQLTINPPAAGRGAVSVNGSAPLRGDDLPWQGVYFQGVDTQITAVPDPGYRFAGWDPPSLPQTASLTLSLDQDLTLTPRFQRDGSPGPQPGSVRFSGASAEGGTPVQSLQGQWIALQVHSLGSVDLRGWRVTDNDSLDATDEGSLIIGDHPALAAVPTGTTIYLVLSESSPSASGRLAQDDLSPLDGRLVLYTTNELLDSTSDPGFAIGSNDTLYLLAPGLTASFTDDIAIDTFPIKTNP